MSAQPPTTTSAARMRTRLRWRQMAAQIARRAREKERVISAWLDDHAYRTNRGVNGNDQLVRLVTEAAAAGMSADEQDALLLAYVHGVRQDLARPDRPAA